MPSSTSQEPKRNTTRRPRWTARIVSPCTRPIRTFFVLLLVGTLLSACDARKRSEETAEAADAAPEVDIRSGAASADEAAPAADGRSLEQQLQDASLAAHVKLALADEKLLRKFDIEPTANAGQVTLTGQVASAEQQELAAELARQIEGVQTVTNEIEAPGVAANPLQDTGRLASALADTTKRQPMHSASDAADDPAQDPQTLTAEAPEENSEEYYTVRSGDNLCTIARKNDTTIAELRRLNDLRGSTLKPGQELRIR